MSPLSSHTPPRPAFFFITPRILEKGCLRTHKGRQAGRGDLVRKRSNSSASCSKTDVSTCLLICAKLKQKRGRKGAVGGLVQSSPASPFHTYTHHSEEESCWVRSSSQLDGSGQLTRRRIHRDHSLPVRLPLYQSLLPPFRLVMCQTLSFNFPKVFFLPERGFCFISFSHSHPASQECNLALKSTSRAKPW